MTRTAKYTKEERAARIKEQRKRCYKSIKNINISIENYDKLKAISVINNTTLLNTLNQIIYAIDLNTVLKNTIK